MVTPWQLFFNFFFVLLRVVQRSGSLFLWLHERRGELFEAGSRGVNHVGFISICFSIFKRGEIGVKQYETSQNVIHCAYRCLWVESSERAGRCLKAESSILCPRVCVSVYVPGTSEQTKSHLNHLLQEIWALQLLEFTNVFCTRISSRSAFSLGWWTTDY